VRSGTRRASTGNSHTISSCRCRRQRTGSNDSSVCGNTDRRRASHSQTSSRTRDSREANRASEIERTGQRDGDSRTSGSRIEVDWTTNANCEVADVRDESCTVSVTATRTGDSDQIGSRSRRGRSARTGNSARDHRKTRRTISGKTSRR